MMDQVRLVLLLLPLGTPKQQQQQQNQDEQRVSRLVSERWLDSYCDTS